jgi:RhtB (resistance to homoserine/threonine) family protein
MDANLPAFAGVAALLIITPGPDTALVTKNALLHGRRAALGTALGVNAGLLVWTAASALGLAALVRASGVAFDALKFVGAAYLIWLGVHALIDARHVTSTEPTREPASRRQLGALGGFRQGIANDLANPKIAVFFTSLLPQFVTHDAPVLLPFLLLGGLFVVMTTAWLSGFALAASTASSALRRPRIKRALDRLTGVVLIGLGFRLATEHR